VASWKWVERWTMDIERFKNEREDLYEQYKRNSSARVFRLERVDLT
jgi:predicted phage-related endonuclease